MDPNQQPTQPTQPAQPAAQPAPAPAPVAASASVEAQPTPVAASTSAPVAPATAPAAPVAETPAATTTETPAEVAEAKTVEQQMEAEIENSRAEDEKRAQMAAAGASKSKEKQNMLICIIAAAAVAVCGILFGVVMMVQKGSAAKEYEQQIATLKKTNAELVEQAGAPAADAVDDTMALKFLQDVAMAQGLVDVIDYAKVYGMYNGAEEITAYWIKYVQNVDGMLMERNAIMRLNEDGAWEVELPGFAEYDPAMMAEYIIF